MRQKYELVRDAVKALSLHQGQIAEAIGYNDPSPISKALSGQNDKALQRIIDYLILEYGYDEAEFYPNLANEMKEVKERVDALETEIRSLKDMILQRLLR